MSYDVAKDTTVFDVYICIIFAYTLTVIPTSYRHSLILLYLISRLLLVPFNSIATLSITIYRGQGICYHIKQYKTYTESGMWGKSICPSMKKRT